MAQSRADGAADEMWPAIGGSLRSSSMGTTHRATTTRRPTPPSGPRRGPGWPPTSGRTAPAYDPTNPSLVFADVSDTDHVERGKAWQRVLHEGGYAGLGWPVEYGGRDLPLSQRVVWAQETAAAGAPPGINLIGEGMVGPTLLAHGTDEQKRRYLPPLLRGDEIWCQLFSEPDAGTDLAAVTTTAVRDGDAGP